MPCGFLSASGSSNFVNVNDDIKKEDHGKFLKQNSRQSAEKHGLWKQGTFQQYNNPKHTQRVAKSNINILEV